MRIITAIAILVFAAPTLAQGVRGGPPGRGGPPRGLEQKLDEILKRLDRLEKRVAVQGKATAVRAKAVRARGATDEHAGRGHDRRDVDRRDTNRRDDDRRHMDRRRGPDRRDFRRMPPRRGGRRGGGRHDMRGMGGPGLMKAHMHKIMAAAKQGNPEARKHLEHLRNMINAVLGAHAGSGHNPHAKPAMAMRKRMATTKTPPMRGHIVTTDGQTFTVVTPGKDFKAVKVTKPHSFKELAVKTYVAQDGKAKKLGKYKKAKATRQFKAQPKVDRKHAEEMQRAKRIADLKKQIAKIQAEMKALKRELAK
ncbi:MAG: prefoldin domain-containing protein [Planctomycetota bacterium]|jgi:hypothetical protein